jgi:hypothetical protein
MEEFRSWEQFSWQFFDLFQPRVVSFPITAVSGQ